MKRYTGSQIIDFRYCMDRTRLHLLCLLMVSLIYFFAVLGSAWLMKQLHDNVFLTFNEQNLFMISVLYLLVNAVISLSVIGKHYIITKVRLVLSRSIRKELTMDLIRYDYLFFTRTDSSEVTSRIFEDTDRISDSVVHIFLGSAGLFSVLVWATLLLVYVRWLFFIYVGLAVLSVIWAVIWSYPVSRAEQETAGLYRMMYQFAFRVVNNIKTIKYELLGNSILREFRSVLSAIGKNSQSKSVMYSLSYGVTIPFLYILNILLIYYGSYHISTGHFSVGIFTLVLIILGYILIPLNDMYRVPLAVGEIRTAFERVRKYRTGQREENGTEIMVKMEKGISFSNVSFSVNGSEILKDISLDIDRGEHIALVGKSGSGKSALLKILLRLYHPDKGRILIDGVDIRTFTLQSLRKRIVMVPQDVSLYPLSLRDNIDIRQSMNCTKIERLVEKLKLGTLVSRLPSRLDTVVSDSFSTFSDGEKQRIGIARGLSLDADVYIFDEITSHLDPETSFSIVQVLQSACRDKTVVFITHDLELAGEFERLFVLTRGKLKEVGNREQRLRPAAISNMIM